MPFNATTNMLTLSNTQAKELAGRFVTIGGVTYYFKDYDKGRPGLPPWRSGAEGKAYPLVGKDGSLAAYLKFFTQPTQKRLNRTAWLIGQQMYNWLPSLVAAPVLWTDTRRGLHGARIDFHFAAYLSRAVPGETWMDLKSGIASGTLRFSEELRWRCVKDLLLALAVLEQAELVHGDLSPNNVIIDLDPGENDPALYLIDFDAFFAPAAGANKVITVAEGGTYGTHGYCPPDLAAAVDSGDVAVAPYSDRFGRDMLLLEFLLLGPTLPADDPLAEWDRDLLQRHFAAWRGRSDPKLVKTLAYLDPAGVFALKEADRPTSVDLATGLGLPLPKRRVLRRVTELTRPTPALLGTSGMRAKPTRVAPAAKGARMDDVFEYLGGRSRSWSNSRDDDLADNSADDELVECVTFILKLMVPIVAFLFFLFLLAFCSEPDDKKEVNPEDFRHR